MSQSSKSVLLKGQVRIAFDHASTKLSTNAKDAS